MSLAFYMDEHVPRSITSGLRLRNIDVLIVQEDGRTGFSDRKILDRATELNRLLFTQDDDFLVEAQHRQESGIFFPGVLYAHQLNISIGGCITDLELISQLATAEELQNTVRYLPL
jgi:predicted nuclease of predicted toxin-antitoxin system